MRLQPGAPPPLQRHARGGLLPVQPGNHGGRLIQWHDDGDLDGVSLQCGPQRVLELLVLRLTEVASPALDLEAVPATLHGNLEVAAAVATAAVDPSPVRIQLSQQRGYEILALLG